VFGGTEMIIPTYRCTCGKRNIGKSENLKAQQEQYLIRRVVVECVACGKQKILGVYD